MVDVKIYEIDNVNYYLLYETVLNGVNYLYLSNVDDESDFIFRKRDKTDPLMLHPLDDDNEVKIVALTFAEKILDK